MNVVLSILFTLIALCGVGFIRNVIVFRVRMRRLDEISSKCKSELGRADFYAVMNRRYEELENRNYYTMVLDVRHWTYRQFFSEPVA
jgi:hypothetical protein